MTEELRAGTWWYLGEDGYRLATATTASDGTRFVWAPQSAWKRRQPEHEYRPLVSHRGLFLKFARLADNSGLDHELDTDKNAAAALKWAQDFGVLGLTPAKSRGAWWGDPRGGSGDTVAAFALEAWAANSTLRLYEAAKRRGGVDVETIVSLAPNRRRGLLTDFPDIAKQWALNKVDANIQYRVARYTYPQLYGRENETPVEGYDFSNLCGALWLQAFFLRIDDDVRLCEYPMCNRVIAYEQPEKPLGHKKGERKEYKTYKNKRFCNNTCVQANLRMKQRL